MASDSQAGGGGALKDRGGQLLGGAGALPGVPAIDPIAAATFEPGDATSCVASHASLARSSLESAAHAYSMPSLHISAIEISSAPHAGSSSDAAAVEGSRALPAPPCLIGRAAPGGGGGAYGGVGDGKGASGRGGGGGGDDKGGAKGGGAGALLPAAGTPASGPSTAATFEPGDATSCVASHASLASSSPESATHAYSVPSLHISAIEISSAPSAGASSSDAAAAGFGAFEGAPSCFESHAAFPALAGSTCCCCGAPCGGPRCGRPFCGGGLFCEGPFCGGIPCGGAPRGGAICGGPFCGAAPRGGAPCGCAAVGSVLKTSFVSMFLKENAPGLEREGTFSHPSGGASSVVSASAAA